MESRQDWFQHYLQLYLRVPVLSLYFSLTRCYSTKSTAAPPTATSPPPPLQCHPRTGTCISSHTRTRTHTCIYLLWNTRVWPPNTHQHAVRHKCIDTLTWESWAGPDLTRRAMKINVSSMSDRLGNWRAEGLVNQEADRCHSGPLNNEETKQTLSHRPPPSGRPTTSAGRTSLCSGRIKTHSSESHSDSK